MRAVLVQEEMRPSRGSRLVAEVLIPLGGCCFLHDTATGRHGVAHASRLVVICVVLLAADRPEAHATVLSCADPRPFSRAIPVSATPQR